MPILKILSHGREVAALQKALTEVGFFDNAVDGIFGPATRDAVIAFQKANRFDPDGIVGTDVLSALASAPTKPPKWDEEALKMIRQGPEVWNEWRGGRSTNLEGAQLDRLRLPGANLEGANLKGASLRGCFLAKANLKSAILTAANLTGSDLTNSDISKADLSKACLNSTLFCRSNLERAKLQGVDGFEVNLRGANLSRANLSKANLIGANLIEVHAGNCKMTKAICIRASMSNAFFADSNFQGAALCNSRLEFINFSRCNLREVDFTHSSLISSDFSGADLTGSRVFGVSAWDLKLEGANQSQLTVAADKGPEVIVDDLEIAQFIYVLLNYRKLKSVFNNVTERGVLLLGRFKDGGLDVLHAIADRLRSHDQKYLPIIFDFERPKDRDLIETIITLAGLSRFVIADLSGPMVPKELGAIVPNIQTPCVQIIQSSREPHHPDPELSKSKWLVPSPVEYEDTEELLSLLNARVIKPAEELRAARLSELRQIFVK